ncbi:hypothetical protein SYK_18760 [Pseudodesulfovibrio nedwellii]|uniref:Uncharacterized protein n=1 Tax=Pseudodesulfovibrio nedwellii TaxID=2973072 RepID=A0ABN6S620_9BACT|nr:hypothetical protein SYK_18760 [Pseudodesulfovibrio nedwellii]
MRQHPNNAFPPPDSMRLGRVVQMCIFSGQIDRRRSPATLRIDLRPKNVQMRSSPKPCHKKKAPTRR